MESHYKDSLSTAIVNILLQCGFENSSKRALDEFVGLSLNYMRNISSKISTLTSDCNLLESDILIGLGALKLHGDNLDDLFNFLHNYNEIFPPQPKVYFGPVPLKPAQKSHEERPQEIVPWAPEMTPALATIGFKLKNSQIVSDPNFDRTKFLALSFKPLSTNSDSKMTNSLSQSQISTNSTLKYGSNCSYQLPPQAYPNKYEPPTIDVDCNGAVIGLNGKSGKLPDPYINDLEEQDILRQKSKFNENHSAKITLHNQSFNGFRRKQRLTNTDESIHNSPIVKRKIVPESPPIVPDHYKSNHVDKTVTSDDAWNAALQATVTPLTKPDPYALNFDSPVQSPVKPLSPNTKKHKKRHRSPSQHRGKKKRRVDERTEDSAVFVSQIYQNESTMDSRTSDNHVPYSPSPDRESPNYSFMSSQVKEKSPSYSPVNDTVPNSIPHYPGSQFSYAAEIIPSASKSKKKKSTRKTHFTNKRKRKPLPTALGPNYNYHYKLDHVDPRDTVLVTPVPPVYSARSHTSSLILSPMMELYADDSDDDGTEPMKESSEEMLRMLELPDNNHNEMVGTVQNSPPYSLLNNKHNHVKDNSSEGGIRMRIKLCKTNSDTNRAGSYVNSITDLSSPPQSQHSDEKNSISERLQFMRDDSPVSSTGRRQYEHSAFDRSPHHSYYGGPVRDNASMSSTQESYRDYYRPVNSVTSGVVSSTLSKSNTPIKFSIKSLDALRQNSASSHSSPKTLPALDDCDNKIPSLSFKTAKSAKKRKRSRLNSSSKKTKPRKSSKQKLDSEGPIAKPIEKNFISVDDVFSDEEDPVKVDQHNHHHHQQQHQYHGGSTLSSSTNAQHQPPPPTPQHTLDQSRHHTPHHTTDKSSPYRLPIPVIKINNKSLSKKPASSTSSKSKLSLVSALSPAIAIKAVAEPKMLYNYSCLQGEAHYKSEDGKVVYICPICNTEDNGSLMLQCDLCQDWYHGLCLGIFDEPPEHVEWFCPRCIEDRVSGRLSSAKTKSSKNRTKKK